jgi:uncharacterized protein YciI
MRILFIFCLLIAGLNIDAQVKTAPEGYQYFEMPAGDSTIVMKQYFLCFLKSGDIRDQGEEESAKIQEQHLAHLARMHEEGHACVAGPLGHDGDLRGIVIYKTATQEVADSLARLDPAVKAGRLKVEVYPWWAMKGAVLN